MTELNDNHHYHRLCLNFLQPSAPNEVDDEALLALLRSVHVRYEADPSFEQAETLVDEMILDGIMGQATPTDRAYALRATFLWLMGWISDARRGAAVPLSANN